MTGHDAPAASRTVERGPPCRRCRERRWKVESRPKGRLRRWVETVFALPDVLIFQSDSGGWPKKQAEVWTCLNCGRTARR
ncbi:MAG TPA: hypothetical protein VNL15_00840 [Dehalococcoidia bacterium]|nr:hypothetical protein [Dehalococcoidia bacterium]